MLSYSSEVRVFHKAHDSSIGAPLASMTSQNGGQDGRHGSNSNPVKGHDL